LATVKSNTTITIDLTKDYQGSGIYDALLYMENYALFFNYIKKEFVYEVFKIIIDNANAYLDKGLKDGDDMSDRIKTSFIRQSWEIVELDGSGNLWKLRNEDTMVSGKNVVGVSVLAEFGTGVVGQKQAHPEASANGYQYNVKEHENGWDFYAPALNMRFKNFEGFEGHRFLYRAMMDFEKGKNPSKLECLKIWNKAKSRYCKLRKGGN